MKSVVWAVGLTFWLFLNPLVNAHFMWVVQNGTSVQVLFSESADAPEPELLKNVSGAKVWAQVADGRGGSKLEAIPLTLTDASLSGAVYADSSAVIVSHDYGVVERGDATFLLKYLAKEHSSPLPGQWSAVNDIEHLPLEITPAWHGNTLSLTVTWQGNPAADCEVKISGCGLDLTPATNERGVVECTPSADGLLCVRAKRVDMASGEVDGKAYDSVRTYSTLSLPVTCPLVESQSHTLPAHPKGITSFGAAVAGNDLYVYGGHFGNAHHYSDEGQSDEFRRISLVAENPQWELLPGGPKLTGLALVEYQGKLYRIGGFTAKNGPSEDQSLWSQDSFASFDSATSQWTDLPAMPAGRSSHDAAVLDGKLYVVGGWNMEGSDSTTWHNTALVWDLAKPLAGWKELPAPDFERRAISLAACNGLLYVVGGMEESGKTTKAVSIFDPKTQTWTAGPSLLGTGMEGFGTSAFAVDGKLVVTAMSGSVQLLAGDGSHWIPAGQTQEPRFFHRQLTTQDGKILLVAGASMVTGKVDSLEVLSLVSH